MGKMHFITKAGLFVGTATILHSSFGNCQPLAAGAGVCYDAETTTLAVSATETPNVLGILNSNSTSIATGTSVTSTAIVATVVTSSTDTITPASSSATTGTSTSTASSSTSTVTGLTVLEDGDDIDGGEYVCEDDDTSVFIANGTVSATLTDVTVVKSGDTSSDDNSSFYGLNAAILASDDAILYITGGSVEDSGAGSNGVFAYGDSTIYITDTTLTITGDNSGGIQVAGGGTMYATDLTVVSSNKAAIRSDRDGGTMVVSGGTFTTSGSGGAPAVYCTANITVENAILTAEGSEALVIEGLNELTLTDCTVTGDMSTWGTEELHNVMLYQSSSGDAEDGTSTFTMNGGSMESLSGCMFYVTNTDAVVTLVNAELTLSGDSTYLFNVSGNDGTNGWGDSGSNGGTATLNLSEQTVTGDIYADSISSLSVNIADSSALTGSMNSDGTTADSLEVTIDSSSTWTLNADSYITSFSGSLDNVEQGSYTLYVNNVAATS